MTDDEREFPARPRMNSIGVQPSGTEPLIRIMAEGPDKAELETLTESIAEAIWNAGATE